MAKRIAAGNMRHLVTIKRHKIEQGTTAYDTYGQLSVSSTAWTAGIERRAAIEQLNGNEATVARQIYPKATYRVTVDYDPTIASTGGSRQAVFYGTRQLHIGAVVNPDMENRQLELLCGEER
jgi:SPP1 family predicted phage head-tail adaptor